MKLCEYLNTHQWNNMKHIEFQRQFGDITIPKSRSQLFLSNSIVICSLRGLFRVKICFSRNFLGFHNYIHITLSRTLSIKTYFDKLNINFNLKIFGISNSLLKNTALWNGLAFPVLIQPIDLCEPQKKLSWFLSASFNAQNKISYYSAIWKKNVANFGFTMKNPRSWKFSIYDGSFHAFTWTSCKLKTTSRFKIRKRRKIWKKTLRKTCSKFQVPLVKQRNLKGW